jgi:hypothetical protein
MSSVADFSLAAGDFFMALILESSAGNGGEK